jgi:hypothetical protein
VTDDIARDPANRFISASTAALKLGVDVATLVRWHNRNRGPVAARHNGAELAYRTRDLEAWQDRIGAGPMPFRVAS